MFNTEKDKKDDEYVIRHKPNRIILFMEKTKWYWPTIFLIIVFGLYTLLNPVSQSNAPTSVEGNIVSILFLSAILLLPFYIGVKLGAKLYKPHESHLTKKQLRVFDDLLGKKDGNISVRFIRKDGRIEVEGEEL